MTSKQMGERFTALIKKKNYTIYRLAIDTDIKTARLYRLASGENDITHLTLPTAVRLARVLGYTSIEDFYKDINIDLFYDKL